MVFIRGSITLARHPKTEKAISSRYIASCDETLIISILKARFNLIHSYTNQLLRQLKTLEFKVSAYTKHTWSCGFIFFIIIPVCIKDPQWPYIFWHILHLSRQLRRWPPWSCFPLRQLLCPRVPSRGSCCSGSESSRTAAAAAASRAWGTGARSCWPSWRPRWCSRPRRRSASGCRWRGGRWSQPPMWGRWRGWRGAS